MSFLAVCDFIGSYTDVPGGGHVSRNSLIKITASTPMPCLLLRTLCSFLLWTFTNYRVRWGGSPGGREEEEEEEEEEVSAMQCTSTRGSQWKA